MLRGVGCKRGTSSWVPQLGKIKGRLELDKPLLVTSQYILVPLGAKNPACRQSKRIFSRQATLNSLHLVVHWCWELNDFTYVGQCNS